MTEERMVDGTGRTVWHAQDCLWWSRERVVELGEEFGPAGPAVANWLECQAKLQNSGGLVKSGYRAITRGVFLQGGVDEARSVVEFAVSIGFLKEFVPASRTFVARVSAYTADQARGRDTLSKADRRAEKPPPDKSGQTRTCPVPVGTGEERTGEDTPSLRSDGSRAGAPAAPAPPIDRVPDDHPAELRGVVEPVHAVLSRVAAARGANAVTLRATAMAIAAFPLRPHLEAALELEHWLVEGTGQRNKVRDVVGSFRNQLRLRWQDQQGTTPAGGPPARRPGRPAGDPAHEASRQRRALALAAERGDEDARLEYERRYGAGVPA